MSKILIIEDEVAIADLEKDYLELSGFDVQIEYAGDKGLTRALKEDFDLIVLDLMLPGIDGFEVCRRIRAVSYTHLYFEDYTAAELGEMFGIPAATVRSRMLNARRRLQKYYPEIKR